MTSMNGARVLSELIFHRTALAVAAIGVCHKVPQTINDLASASARIAEEFANYLKIVSSFLDNLYFQTNIIVRTKLIILV